MLMPRGPLALAAWLGFRDWIVEWRLSLCLALGVAAAAAPLLILFSIRAGIVGGMRDQLARDPSSRELHTLGQGRITPALVARLRRDPAVGFVAPEARLLSASAVLRGHRGGAGEVVDLAPSGPGDPLGAAAGGAGVRTRGELLVSEMAARTRKLRRGDQAGIAVERVRRDGVRESVRLRLRVAGIVPGWAAEGRLALIAPALLDTIEIYREAPRATDFAAATAIERAGRGQRRHAGLRLYAASIDAVGPLRDRLLRAGIPTEGRLAEIRLIRRTSGALMTVFLIVAAVVGAGLCLSLAAAQWAWVERRRRDLGYLRLVGLDARQVALLPAVQSLLTVALGTGAGALLAMLCGGAVNRAFAAQLAGFGAVSRLEWRHVAVALALGLLGGLLASLLAAGAAARVTPASVLREA